MPTAAADDLYWNPMELDSDESSPYASRPYIDPWDLENYAYIRQHLDAGELGASEPSSLGEPLETSAFHYIAARPLERTLGGADDDSVFGERPEKIYDARQPPRAFHQDAEYYYTTRRAATRYERRQSAAAAAYTDVDELQRGRAGRRASCAGSIYGGSLPAQPPPQQGATFVRRGSATRTLPTPAEDIYECGYEPNDADLYGIPENSSLQIYEKNKTLRRQQMSKNDGPVAKMAKSRSHSFSVGDLEYDPYRMHTSIYDVHSEIYDSTGSSPIYDDIRSSLTHRSKPKHFKLSNYGHLKIDYSFSWNNLNKYIYN